MSGPPHPEPLNEEGFKAFSARVSEDSPVVLLNLLRFLPDGGRERYAEYRAAIAPLLEKVGARVLFLGQSDLPVLGEEAWDAVLLVEYPTRQAVLDMVASEEHQEIAHLRAEALAVGELHPIDPSEPTLS